MILSKCNRISAPLTAVNRDAAYRHRFPDEPAMKSLANWHGLEQDNLDTFAGMHYLLVRKT